MYYFYRKTNQGALNFSAVQRLSLFLVAESLLLALPQEWTLAQGTIYNIY